MCMLFVCTLCQDPLLLVVASTRDEFYHRPAKACHSWDENPDIVGGMDVEEGKRGGTWLAMNRRLGRVAALLNLMRPISEIDATKRDRGFLAVNYLENSLDGMAYLKKLSRSGNEYNDFVLVTLDIREDLEAVSAAYYTNHDDQNPVALEPGVHVFGNSAPNRPWKKVQSAQEMFQRLMSTHKPNSSNEKLMSDIFQLLSNETLHYPDEQLTTDSEGRPEEYVRQLSSIFVKTGSGTYGSRTHTVIIVDRHGTVDYVERTLREPIDDDDRSSKDDWVTTRARFPLLIGARAQSHL